MELNFGAKAKNKELCSRNSDVFKETVICFQSAPVRLLFFCFKSSVKMKLVTLADVKHSD